jgi:hypothetical protein
MAGAAGTTGPGVTEFVALDGALGPTEFTASTAKV